MTMNPLLLDIPDSLESPRLRLRVPRAGDGAMVARSVQASLSELKVWMIWATEAYDETAGEEWSRKASGDFISRKQLAYFLFTRHGQHVGNINAFNFDWDIPACEIGYWLRTDHCGQGLMAEAVDALVDMLMTKLDLKRVQIKCDDRNERSGRVAERCGFALDGIIRVECKASDGSLRNTRIYSRLREEKDSKQ